MGMREWDDWHVRSYRHPYWPFTVLLFPVRFDAVNVNHHPFKEYINNYTTTATAELAVDARLSAAVVSHSVRTIRIVDGVCSRVCSTWLCSCEWVCKRMVCIEWNKQIVGSHTGFQFELHGCLHNNIQKRTVSIF